MAASPLPALVLIQALAAPGVAAPPLVTVSPEDVGFSSERLARVGAYLHEQVAKERLPGAVLLVARKGRIAYLEAFGNRDPVERIPMTKDAVFRVHSMTKPWVSVAAMMLLEEGRLQLGDPVSRWFPAFKKMQVSVPVRDPKPGEAAFTLVPAEREMTVLDLLRHTSGLTYDRFSKNGPVREAYARAGLGIGPGTDLRTRTPVEFVERLSQAPLAIQPGSEWEYGLSTDLLGLVIEAVEGARLSEVLGRRIFVPLGMADSGFQVTPANSGRLARPLPSERGSGTTSGYVDVSVPPRLDSGGQGGVSTASDYFRFCQMILDGGRLDGTRILSRASVALMGTDQLGTAIRAPPVMAMGSPGYTWGLGFAVRRPSGPVAVLGSPGELYWGGAPSGGGFWIDPREQTVVVFLTSASWSDYGTYRAVVKQMVNAALTD